jgi:hypothetical protein
MPAFLDRRFISLRTRDMESRSVLALQLDNTSVLGQSFSSSSTTTTTPNNGITISPVLSPVNSVSSQTELDDFVLGALQSKILVALIISKTGTLTSGMITKKAGISASSWAKIKLNMIDQGLVICTHKRDLTEGRVIGSVEVKLTKKGVLIAQNLLLIATILGKLPESVSGPESGQKLLNAA